MLRAFGSVLAVPILWTILVSWAVAAMALDFLGFAFSWRQRRVSPPQ